MGKSVARFEIAASDLNGLRSFYADLFDWHASRDNPKYSVVDTGDGIGGMIFKADAGIPTFVTVYIDVDDCEKYLAKVEQLGGTVYVPVTESPVPGEKCFAVFGDPEGNLVGICERA